jgi:LmbE family N-acetylglucosaminyl deacetylase
MKNALVLAAHPDDAELMVGGLIALLGDSGFHVSVAFFTTAPESPSGTARRQRAAREAAAILGNDILWVEDGKYDHVTDMSDPQCVACIDELLKKHEPEIVITHTVADSHCDHVQLGRCTISATRRSGALFLAFGPSEYRAQTGNSFVPNVFVDVSAYMERKRAAIDCYNYDDAPYRPLRANEIALLNQANGLSCGAQYAETLQVIRVFGVPTDLVGVPRVWRS